MSTSAQTDPLIGRLVDGRYRVRARIARGGMATVYVATDLRLERRVALKVMHGHLSDDTVFQSRFIQEARAAARLADPHVVNVFDQVDVASSSSETPATGTAVTVTSAPLSTRVTPVRVGSPSM